MTGNGGFRFTTDPAGRRLKYHPDPSPGGCRCLLFATKRVPIFCAGHPGKSRTGLEGPLRFVLFSPASFSGKTWRSNAASCARWHIQAVAVCAASPERRSARRNRTRDNAASRPHRDPTLPASAEKPSTIPRLLHKRDILRINPQAGKRPGGSTTDPYQTASAHKPIAPSNLPPV